MKKKLITLKIVFIKPYTKKNVDRIKIQNQKQLLCRKMSFKGKVFKQTNIELEKSNEEKDQLKIIPIENKNSPVTK